MSALFGLPDHAVAQPALGAIHTADLDGTPVAKAGTPRATPKPPALDLAATTIPKVISSPSPLSIMEDSGQPFRTALGYQSLSSNTTGLWNSAFPCDAPTASGQNQTFIAGIYGTPLSGPTYQVVVNANGQLGMVTPPVQLKAGGMVTPLSVLQQKVHEQEQQTTIAELRAQLARLEATNADLTRGSPRWRRSWCRPPAASEREVPKGATANDVVMLLLGSICASA